MTELKFDDFPSKTFDKIRYGDTDRQGHVNNAVFATFLETGRVELLYDARYPFPAEGLSFVIVSLKLDLLKEINWPGRVDIGTGVLRIGNSSITFFQRIFQNGVCVAEAETVIVQVDHTTGQSAALTNEYKKILSGWMLGGIEGI